MAKRNLEVGRLLFKTLWYSKYITSSWIITPFNQMDIFLSKILWMMLPRARYLTVGQDIELYPPPRGGYLAGRYITRYLYWAISSYIEKTLRIKMIYMYLSTFIHGIICNTFDKYRCWETFAYFVCYLLKCKLPTQNLCLVINFYLILNHVEISCKCVVHFLNRTYLFQIRSILWAKWNFFLW